MLKRFIFAALVTMAATISSYAQGSGAYIYTCMEGREELLLTEQDTSITRGSIQLNSSNGSFNYPYKVAIDFFGSGRIFVANKHAFNNDGAASSPSYGMFVIDSHTNKVIKRMFVTDTTTFINGWFPARTQVGERIFDLKATFGRLYIGTGTYNNGPGLPEGYGRFIKLNTGTLEVEREITLPDTPFAITLSPDETKAYIYGHRISVIDLNTFSVITSPEISPAFKETVSPLVLPNNMAISADGSRLYVPSYGKITVVDTSTLMTIDELPGQPLTFDVRISRDGKKLFASDAGNPRPAPLLVIDIASRQATEIPVNAKYLGIQDLHGNGSILYANSGNSIYRIWYAPAQGTIGVIDSAGLPSHGGKNMAAYFLK